MPRHVFKIEEGLFGLSLTAPTPAPTDVCDAAATGYTDFTCQVTSGSLTASANVTDETIPATWCSPESTEQNVGETSYSLELSILQDPDVSAGLSAFLFTHDTEIVYWYMGMAGDDPPKATGVARCVAGTIGGEARVALTADVSLPVTGKPAVCFGDATTSVPVEGTLIATMDAVAGEESWITTPEPEPVEATA